jgi:hypothetical protein
MGTQVCPFCGGPETDRIEIDGRRFLVFGCLFTPEVDVAMDEVRLAEHLARSYRPGDSTYFRGMCDRLHLYVTKGPGARALTDPSTGSASP